MVNSFPYHSLFSPFPPLSSLSSPFLPDLDPKFCILVLVGIKLQFDGHISKSTLQFPSFSLFRVLVVILFMLTKLWLCLFLNGIRCGSAYRTRQHSLHVRLCTRLSSRGFFLLLNVSIKVQYFAY